MKIRRATKKDIIPTQEIVYKTFKSCNIKEGTKKGVERYLQYHNPKENLEKIKERFKKTKIFFVAIEKGKIVGMIRGNKSKIGNLFVDTKHHGKGIARKLVERFEKEAKKLGSKEIKILSSLYATHFYQKMDYKKTTGIRKMRGIKVQPMKKDLK